MNLNRDSLSREYYLILEQIEELRAQKKAIKPELLIDLKLEIMVPVTVQLHKMVRESCLKAARSEDLTEYEVKFAEVF